MSRRAYVILLAVSIASTALAQAPAPTAADQARARAEALKAEADRAYIAKAYTRALELLKAAYDADPQPRYVANQGLVLEQLGRHAEAVKAFERFLAGSPRPPADKAAAARKVLERLKPPVTIDTTPPGATVSIDGGPPIGLTPLTTRLVAGDHTINLTLDGYAPAQNGVKVLVADGLSYQATMVPLPEAPKPPPPGLGTDGWGYIALGGAGLAFAGSAALYALGLDEAETRDGATTGEAWDEAQSRLELYDTASIAAAGVAGAALTTGIILLLIDDEPPVTASPGPDGITVRGRF